MENKQPNETPSVDQLKAELAREKYKSRYGQTLRSTVYILIVVAAVAVLMATLFFPDCSFAAQSWILPVTRTSRGSRKNCGCAT